MSASPMAAAMLAEQARAWARVAVVGAVGARLKAALDLQRGEAGVQERATRARIRVRVRLRVKARVRGRGRGSEG